MLLLTIKKVKFWEKVNSIVPFHRIIRSKRRQAWHLYCSVCGSTSLEILQCTEWLLQTKNQAHNLKIGFASPVLLIGFAGKQLSCNNMFLSRNTAYGLSVLDQRFQWFKINYKFQFKNQREIFCPSSGITDYSQQQILLNFI